MSIAVVVYNILAMPSLLYGCGKGYRKTNDSRDEIHETHSRTQFKKTM
jgi:hypothetical protein